MWADRSLYKGAHGIRGADSIDECICLRARSRRRDLLELAGIYGLILLVIWTPHPYERTMWCIAAIVTVAVIAVSFEGLEPMGLCTANLRRSLWGAGLAAGLALAAVALAERMHTLHAPPTLSSSLTHFVGYALWATVQEIILQCFFLMRSLRLVGNAGLAACLSACLFVAAHLPNPVLTAITLVLGLAACSFYLYYRNVWPLALAHALLGIAIAITIPPNLDHNMRVGMSYLTWADRPVVAAGPAAMASRQ